MKPKQLGDLGKLPPQTPDMEEAVLGAIMLEKGTFDRVSTYLTPEHFYVDAHSLIYAACRELSRESKPIDIRTVRSKLLAQGKLEVVGGPVYLAELTMKVSSSANVEAHAKEIIEMSIRRDIITLTADINQKSYDTGRDTLEMLEDAIALLQRTKDNATVENSEDRIKAEWQERMLTVEPPPDIPLISIGGVQVASVANHSLLTGKKKARKTLFITWLIQQYFLQNANTSPDDILLFDTEQGKTHVWKVRERIKKLTGYELPIFFLRGMAPDKRRNFIDQTCKHWKRKPRLIVVDGVRDCMNNINDPIETTDVIVWLESLIVNYNVHIINVLHLNKGDSNPRGHLGTELQNKAEVSIELEKDENAGCTIVKCESSREKEFETFAFTHGQDELPEVVGTPIQNGNGVIMPMDERKVRIHAIFGDGPMTYKELLEEVKAQFDVSKHKANALIAEWGRNGWIIKTGKPRDPHAVYKLISQDLTLPTVRESSGHLKNVNKALEPELDFPDLPF